MREVRELERVRRRYDSRTGSVARQFDRICTILSTLGYLDALGDGYVLTDRGQLLRRLYSEQDLVLAQAICAGTFDMLPATCLASVLSSLVYEARRGSGGEPRYYPGGIQGPVAWAAQELRGIHGDIRMRCEDAGLDVPSQLDFGIVDIMYEWADGADLAKVLRGVDMTGGDFVRNAKRLTDMLQQIATAAPLMGARGETLAATAREAAALVSRGVVAYSGVD